MNTTGGGPVVRRETDQTEHGTSKNVPVGSLYGIYR